MSGWESDGSASLGSRALAGSMGPSPPGRTYVSAASRRSAYGDGLGISAPISSSGPHPWFPPPPTAEVHESKWKKTARSKGLKALRLEGGAALQSADSIPPPPAQIERVGVVRKAVVVQVSRAKSTRKTILGRIDGWWDLNLIESRKAKAPPPLPLSVRPTAVGQKF